jgi:nucleotide-binding universal stress UspA family protein
MSDAPDNAAAAQPDSDRIFLVVVDETEEMKVALRFACRRAQHTRGRVALLYVIEPSEFQHWMAVGDLMREEARTEGEQLLQRLAAEVNELVGSIPVLHVREGKVRDELFTLLEEEPGISILVLGANTGSRGPGPLVTALAGKMVGKLRIPLTIVPGDLSDEEIDQIA